MWEGGKYDVWHGSPTEDAQSFVLFELSRDVAVKDRTVRWQGFRIDYNWTRIMEQIAEGLEGWNAVKPRWSSHRSLILCCGLALASSKQLQSNTFERSESLKMQVRIWFLWSFWCCPGLADKKALHVLINPDPEVSFDLTSGIDKSEAEFLHIQASCSCFLEKLVEKLQAVRHWRCQYGISYVYDSPIEYGCEWGQWSDDWLSASVTDFGLTEENSLTIFEAANVETCQLIVSSLPLDTGLDFINCWGYTSLIPYPALV